MKILQTLIFVAFLGFIGLTGTYEGTSSRVTVCTNYKDNIYTFTDSQGNDWEWEAEDNDNFEVGKTYKLIMDNNHSSNIYDDIIKKIKEF